MTLSYGGITANLPGGPAAGSAQPELGSTPADRRDLLAPVTLLLGRGAVMSVRSAGPGAWRGAGSGARIRCLSGRLWITQEGDAADHVLGPSETFDAAAPGLLVIQAVGRSTVSVSEVAFPARERRPLLKLLGRSAADV